MKHFYITDGYYSMNVEITVFPRLFISSEFTSTILDLTVGSRFLYAKSVRFVFLMKLIIFFSKEMNLIIE